MFYNPDITIPSHHFSWSICGVGLIVGFVFILAHLIHLKSLGSPYLLLLYPFRGLGTAEGLLRLPFSQTAERASFKAQRNGAMIQTKRKKT